MHALAGVSLLPQQQLRRSQCGSVSRARRCAAAPLRTVRAEAQRAPDADAAPTQLLGRRGLLHLATACSCCAAGLRPALANGNWSYGGASGVAAWPEVSKTCAAGGAQSPINLVAAAAEAAALNMCACAPMLCPLTGAMIARCALARRSRVAASAANTHKRRAVG
jgi:hypothetical protein